MTDRSNLITGAAIGLLALISISACDDRTERATSGSTTTGGPQAATGETTDMAGMDHSTMAGIDPSTMPGMDHSSMPGMAPSPRPAAPGGTTGPSAMAGMDHATMSGMDHSGMAGMSTPPRTAARGGTSGRSAMAGMDHSNMQGMNQAAMPGMAPAARPTTPAGAMDHTAMSGMDHSAMQGMDHASMPGMAPAPQTAASAGATDHSAMQGMDHSGMSGMAGMTVTPPIGTTLSASSPANGAMVQGSPGAISLTLTEPMTFQSVSLSNAIGQRIPLSSALPDGPVVTFMSPTPTLPAGNYTVAWTAGTGTRTLNGTFAFMVH